jgi:hypothetical protein
MNYAHELRPFQTYQTLYASDYLIELKQAQFRIFLITFNKIDLLLNEIN